MCRTALVTMFHAVLVAMLVAVPRASAGTQESLAALQDVRRGVEMVTLDNGLRVIFYRRGTAPVFAGVVAVRVGGVDEKVGATGISHMFEHMAFKGTPLIGTKDYDKERKLLDELEKLMVKFRGGVLPDAAERKKLEELNAALEKVWEKEQFTREFEKRGGTGLNASTDKELTNYYVSMPQNAFEFWCWMESERLLNPVMRQFYQERDVVMEERRQRYDDDPQGKLYESLLSQAFNVHPYRNPVIGYPGDIAGLTASATDAFRRTWYVPSNMVVSLVGDVDKKRDLKVVEKYFGRIPKAPAVDHSVPAEPPQTAERRFSLNSPTSPQIFIAYHKPQFPHEDDPALGVMLEVLGGSRRAPLYKELVLRTRVASEVGHFEAPGDAYPNLMMFYGVPKAPATNAQLLRVFDSVLARFRESTVNEEELEIAKRAIAMQYLGHLKSNSSLAADFASSELIHGNWGASFDWYERMLATTPADVKRVARTYLQPARRTVGTIDRAASSGQ